MCDNEYVAHLMVRERIREAEARGALLTLLRDAEAPKPDADGGRDLARSPRPEGWWQAPAAWVAHLTLPKILNRL